MVSAHCLLRSLLRWTEAVLVIVALGKHSSLLYLTVGELQSLPKPGINFIKLFFFIANDKAK